MEGETSGDGTDPVTETPVAMDPGAAAFVHADDLSSDDDDGGGLNNRIGRVPLHWYDEHDHIGYDAHGSRVAKMVGKAAGQDGIDVLLKEADDRSSKGKFVVRDELNARDVELSQRQIELIRRVQMGAYAHPEPSL